MSGHSKWSTIKRQKQANDKARGKLFSKLSRAISVAVKTGGSNDPEANFKLRDAIDKAREANMPKENIKRAISRAEEAGDLEEVVYEGFGPNGIGFLVVSATNNRNRTAQEIKNIFEKVGGSMGGPGSVSFNFVSKGLITIKSKNKEEDMLKLIDLGVDELEESEEGIEMFVDTNKLNEVKKTLEENEFDIASSELIQKPKTTQQVTDPTQKKKLLSLFENFDNHGDVQKVFANADFSG